MYIVDQNIAYVVCSNGDIWKTTDGGILVPLGVDLELNAFQTPAIITQTANPLYLSILFKNVGGQNINNSSISYQVDGGTPVNGTITFTPAIANSGMVISNHPNSLNASLSLGLHTLKAWINTLNNGTTDMNHNNDTLSMQVKVVASPLKNKKVILEEATGAWCGNCPGGIAVVDYLYDSITASGSNRFIPIAIHNSDAMDTVKGDSISSTWDQGAFPMGWVDRKKDINESGVGMSVSKWYPAVLSGLKNDAPVSLNTTVTYNSGNRLVTINCNADFLVNINRELRYHVFILEDSLLSNQVNYLNTVQGSPFFGLGNPIVNYKNKHVLREVITPGGVWGTKIPAASIATGSYTFSLNYTLPNNINETKATVVVFVTYHDADINKREIINADALPVKQSVGIVAFQNNPVLLNAYPNPAYQSISLRIIAEQQSAVTFEIIDLTGKVISQATRPLSNGVNYLELNTAELPEGLYFIKASDGKNNYSGKFTKIHN